MNQQSFPMHQLMVNPASRCFVQERVFFPLDSYIDFSQNFARATEILRGIALVRVRKRFL